MIRATYLRTSVTPRDRRAALAPQPEPELVRARDGGGRYGDDRPRWVALALVALAHVGLIAALIAFDVIEVRKPHPTLTVVDITPDAPPPPPKERPPEEARHAPPQETPPIAPPPPLVAVPAPPPPVQVAPPAPPPPPAPPAAPAPVTSGEGPSTIVALPGILSATPPKYPVEARMRHQQGTVRLLVTIDPQGHVTDVSLAKTSGVEALDKAALASVRNWRFRPRVEAGEAVGATGYISIPFALT